MKKLFSAFLSFTILMITLLSFPVASNAAVYEPNETIYSDAYMLVNLDDDSYPVVAQKNQDITKHMIIRLLLMYLILTVWKSQQKWYLRIL